MIITSGVSGKNWFRSHGNRVQKNLIVSASTNTKQQKWRTILLKLWPHNNEADVYLTGGYFCKIVLNFMKKMDIAILSNIFAQNTCMFKVYIRYQMRN